MICSSCSETFTLPHWQQYLLLVCLWMKEKKFLFNAISWILNTVHISKAQLRSQLNLSGIPFRFNLKHYFSRKKNHFRRIYIREFIKHLKNLQNTMFVLFSFSSTYSKFRRILPTQQTSGLMMT